VFSLQDNRLVYVDEVHTVVKRPFLSILGSSLTQAAYRQGIDNDSKRYV